jgi:hypothetical protein
VLRFAKNKVLTSECFVMAMVRLHLAHGVYPTRTRTARGGEVVWVASLALGFRKDLLIPYRRF